MDDKLSPMPSSPPMTPDVRESLIERINNHAKLVFLLDYDGTLVPFALTPGKAFPDPELLDLLRVLTQRPNTAVHIVSGRDRQTLEQWFAGLSIGLHAEHGLWNRLDPRDDWRTEHPFPPPWKTCVLPLLEQSTRCTPGSLIEHKSASIAWHYRMAAPEFGAFQAKELHLHLAEVLSNFPVHVLSGDKVIEVKLRSVDKGQVVSAFFSNLPDTLLVALGDDRTDEDLFAALPENGVAIHVGANSSRAPYRLDDYRAVRSLLRAILDKRPPR